MEKQFSLIKKNRRVVKQTLKFIHDTIYHDQYSYFKSNPKSMQNYIQSENDRTKQFYANETVHQLFLEYLDESSQRKDTRKEDLAEVYGDYSYCGTYNVFNCGNDYQIIHRTNIITKEQEVVLDIGKITQFAKHQNTMSLTKTVISDDHQYIAFGIDLENDERTTWMIKHMKEDAPRKYREQLKGCSNAKFSSCGNYLVYVQMDDKFRPCQVKLHRLGTQQDDDIIIYEEINESFYLDLQQSKDKEYYVILSGSKNVNKIYVLPRNKNINAANPLKPICLIPESLQCLAYCQHARGQFYVLTNKGVHDFKVQIVDDKSLISGQPQFQDFYFPDEGEVINELDLFEDNLVLYIKKISESYIKVVPLDGSEKYLVKIPAAVVYSDSNKQQRSGLLTRLYDKFIKKDKSDSYIKKCLPNEIVAATISPGLNENYRQKRIRFHVDTPLIYNQVYEFEFASKQLFKLEDCNFTGKPFNREQFTCQIIQAPSTDGTLIPITIVHHRDTKLNRQNKLLLHSYGAYGIAQDVPFNVVYLSALQRGWVLAYAHIRGGNELGHHWHTQAIQKNKHKSMEDLISCAQYLVARGYTHPALLCALGASAGATVLASAVNMRPDLWKCVIYSNPFLDVLGNLLDKDLPLTIPDFEEFGNPIDDPDTFEYIKGYSPYDNILENVYPAKLIIAGTNDYRAPLWGVMKYAQRFRDTAKKSEKVMDIVDKGLVVDIIDSGHYGKAGIMAGIEERAKQMAFLEYFIGPGNKEASKENLTEDIDSGLYVYDELKVQQPNQSQKKI